MSFFIGLPIAKKGIVTYLKESFNAIQVTSPSAYATSTELATQKQHLHPKKTSMDYIRVAIVEDERQYRDWIAEELASVVDIQVVGTFATGEDALTQVAALQPNIVIMDLMLGKNRMSGTECIFKLRLESPAMKFLVLSSHIDETHVFEALQVGARAYLQKGDIPGKLGDMIRDFYNDIPRMSPVIAQMIMDHFNKPTDTLRLLETLSSRELEVLHTLAEGLTYDQVGDRLFIARGTVAQHANRIYEKLRVNCLAEAIRIYLR